MDAERSDLIPGRFDDEVNRAIFKTRIFAFDGDWRPNSMGPAVLARRLKGKITHRGRLPDPLTVAIKTLAEWLVRLTEGAGKGNEKTALDFQSTLCDAAAYHLRPHVVRMLLKTPLEPFPENPSPIDKLAAAAAVGNLQDAQKLLAGGVEPNEESNYLGYPVQNAALNNYEDLVALLLQEPSKYLSCSATSYTKTANGCTAALIAASSAGHDNIMEYILFSSLALTPPLLQVSYSAAARVAAMNGHIEVLRSVLRSQALSPSSEGTAAAQDKTQVFFTACAGGYPKLVHMLLSEFSVDANVTNHEGRNGLHMAARGGHARVVSLLLEKGTRYYASRMGDPVFLAAKNGYEEAVRVLLDAGADVNADGGFSNILSTCAGNGETSMIRFLLSRGLVLEVEGRGDVALELAAEKGQVEVVELLVGLGVHVDGRKGRDGPMLRALLYGQDKVVEALRGFGAKDVDVRESEYMFGFEDGEYPLIWNP